MNITTIGWAAAVIAGFFMPSRMSFFGRFLLPALILFAVWARADPATETKPSPAVSLPPVPLPPVEVKPETLVDDAGRFVVRLPNPVKRGSQEVSTAVGKIPMNMVYYDGGAVAYMVIYCDYPAGSVAQSGGPEAVCKNARDGAVKSVNGTVRTSSPCQLGDVNGLEVVADIPPGKSADKSVAHLRFFVVGERLYQLMYIGPTGKETSPEAVDFLDSFRLTH